VQGDNHPDKKALIDARERVVARLTDGFARDEIGLDQFEQRVNDAYQSRTPAQLEALVADLEDASSEAKGPVVVEAELVPATGTPANGALVPAHASAAPRVFARAILGTAERSGSFALPPENAQASAVLGSLVIDLRDVVLPPGLTEVRVRAVLGSIEVFVPADMNVECEGSGILGSFEGTSRSVAALDPDAPRLRIVGSAVLGSIEVRSRPPSRVQHRLERLGAAAGGRPRKLLPR
jgi:hypothetical protein